MLLCARWCSNALLTTIHNHYSFASHSIYSSHIERSSQNIFFSLPCTQRIYFACVLLSVQLYVYFFCFESISFVRSFVAKHHIFVSNFFSSFVFHFSNFFFLFVRCININFSVLFWVKKKSLTTQKLPQSFFSSVGLLKSKVKINNFKFK